MGDEKKTEDLEDVEGGEFINSGAWTGTEDVAGGASTPIATGPLDDVEGGDGAQTPVNPQITD